MWYDNRRFLIGWFKKCEARFSNPGLFSLYAIFLPIQIAEMSGVNSINNVDSINRPTSKVLRPPGGASSNIFGSEPEPVAPRNNNKRQQSSNIFGGGEETADQPKSSVKYPGGKGSNIFGAEPEVQKPVQKTSAPSSNIFATEEVKSEPQKEAKPQSSIFGDQDDNEVEVSKEPSF